MIPTLTELGRRVLCHLPVWVEDEKAHMELEGGPDVSIRSYELGEFTVRLSEDPCIQPALSEESVLVCLEALAAEGLCVEKDGWRMTELGRDALIAEPDEQQTPGAVTVGLHPAVGLSDAKGA